MKKLIEILKNPLVQVLLAVLAVWVIVKASIWVLAIGAGIILIVSVAEFYMDSKRLKDKTDKDYPKDQRF